jgi:CheY-like chemotaxis protein
MTSPASSPTILIVEDDENDQMFIRRAFKHSGVDFRLAVVNDGEEATMYLRGTDLYADRALHPLPRLIMTDLKMPRMGGLAFLTWIKAQPVFRTIPTVVLTSSSDRADVAQAFARGASGYMIKPVQFDELKDVIRTIARYWGTSCVPHLEPTTGA